MLRVLHIAHVSNVARTLMGCGVIAHLPHYCGRNATEGMALMIIGVLWTLPKYSHLGVNGVYGVYRTDGVLRVILNSLSE